MGTPALGLVHATDAPPVVPSPSTTVEGDGTCGEAAKHGPRTHGADPGRSAPRYIQACHHEAWKLVTWKKDAPGEIRVQTARCYSWRHEGECQRAKCAEDYSRIAEALAGHKRADIVYAVLTLDPSAWTGEGWAGSTRIRKAGAVQDSNAMQAAFAQLVDRWREFAKRCRKRWGDFGYVSTVESHKSGWPHLNVIIACPGMAEDVAAAMKTLEGWSRKAKGREAARIVLGATLQSAGFGPIGFVESAGELDADGGDPLAGYISKLAGEVGAPFDGKEAGGLVDSIGGKVVAEVVKHSQVPHKAPPGFRRLRSSKGFLPKKRRDENITGELLDEVGQKIGVGRVERWLEACSRYESAPGVMRRLIDQSMFEWLKKLDRPLTAKEKKDFDLAGRILHGVGKLKPDDSVPRGVIIESISAQPIRGPGDIDRVLGPWGPGMQKIGRTYRLRPELMFTPSRD